MFLTFIMWNFSNKKLAVMYIVPYAFVAKHLWYPEKEKTRENCEINSLGSTIRCIYSYNLCQTMFAFVFVKKSTSSTKSYAKENQKQRHIK